VVGGETTILLWNHLEKQPQEGTRITGDSNIKLIYMKRIYELRID
jgi:hypothetical protein